MSGSPLLEPMRRRKSGSPAAMVESLMRPESPLRPRVLAPLFTNVALSEERGTRAATAGSDDCSQNVDPDESPSKGLSPHSLARLVPKDVAKLAASGRGRDALLGMVDPQPDWTLGDLRDELEELTEKMSGSRLREEGDLRESESVPQQRWGLSEEVADFNRISKPFVMRLDDEDFESSDDDDDDEEEDVFSQNDPGRDRQAPVVHNSSRQKFTAFDRVLTHKSPYDEDAIFLTTSKVEAALFEAERLRILRVQEELRQKRFQLESALLEETQRSAEKIAQVMKDEEAKCEMTRRSDKQYQRLIAEQRDKHLSALQRDHEQRSQVEERKIKKDEEAQRREHSVREEMERQQKAKADAEIAAAKAAEAQRIRKLEEQVAAEAEKKRQAEAAQKAEADRKENESAKPSRGAPQLRVSKSAADNEMGRKKILQQLNEASKSLQANPVLRKNLKALGFQIGKLWNQVAATEEQVRKVSMEFLQLANNPQSQPFVVSTLASKLMSQCEAQVLRAPSYAFVFARIVVNVSSQLPVVMDAVLAHLNVVCILTVPKYFMYKKVTFSSFFFPCDKSYYNMLGFREDDSGTLETADDYVARMTAYVTLYAAITQTGGTNGHGIANGWKWCAQLLNHLPANRYSASALFAFLETAGFRLYQSYPKPFMKLMNTIVTRFVPLLQKHNDPDARSVLNRLETYLGTKQFTKRPKDELTQQQTVSAIALKEASWY
ncbi:hypothetical protein SELMODRAFT_402470 [Selaginella moellendorffii]|uniref:mRNA export factor GLE1 n=1 Tax=Selaginella moellendorffii TaxID=88036 RepID=D8QQR4_SELML|nr:hypothetical protein SELMODRAFT_402470 [Selaginella moellendorffii]